MTTELPFQTENDLEARICADVEWRRGVEWGKPRPGHPEGAVKIHIAQVLENVDRYSADPEERRRLRLIALTHDSFKHRVDPRQPRVGENHHGMIARRFTERFVPDDRPVLDVIGVVEQLADRDPRVDAQPWQALGHAFLEAQAPLGHQIARLTPSIRRL